MEARRHWVVRKERTCHMFGLLGDLDGIVGGKDAPRASAHVVGLVPIVLSLQLHQQGVIYFQLQFILMPRHKPGPNRAHEEPAPRALSSTTC